MASGSKLGAILPAGSAARGPTPDPERPDRPLVSRRSLRSLLNRRASLRSLLNRRVSRCGLVKRQRDGLTAMMVT